MSELTDFLRVKKDKNQEIDYGKIKSDWLADIQSFYARVKQWLHEPISEKLLSIKEGVADINEEHLGPYQAPALFISTEWSSVSLVPVARFVVGAQGRIDMKSTQGLGAILLHLEEADGKHWFLLDKQKMERLRIDEKLYQSLLKDML